MEDKIQEIDKKLEQTEDDEITISLLYQKVDLLEEIIGKLKNQNKLASKEHEERFNELEAEIQKKDKIIDEIAPRIYLTEQEREKMKQYIENSNKPKDFSSFVKQYFERKVEE